MNIHNQLCGLIIMFLILFLYFRQKRVGLRSEKVFIRTIHITIFCVLCDIFSIIAIYNMDIWPIHVVHFICKIYLCMLIWTGYVAFAYVIADIQNEGIKYRKRYIWLTMVSIENLIIYVLPIDIFLEGDVVYTSNWAVLMTYIFALKYVATTIGILVLGGKKLNPKRREASLIWMIMWMIASLIQFVHNELLVVGFTCGLGMLTLYCTLENPSTCMDRNFDCFHANAFMEYIRQCYRNKRKQSILYISISLAENRGETNSFADEAIQKIIALFSKDKNVKIFKDIEYDLILVFPDGSTMSERFEKIEDELYADYFYNPEQNGGSMPATLFVLIPDILMLRDADEVIYVTRHMKNVHSSPNKSQVIYVDDSIVAEFRKKVLCQKEILSALQEDRVEVFYQPIFCIRSNQFSSAEALARIRNSDGSLMYPGDFIPVAEETGLIALLGERIFEKTCEFLTSSEIVRYGIDYIEVNLSALQCEQRNLADHYMRIMNRYKVEPWRINLEITETGKVEERDILLNNMKRLIDYGVSFSLDDFGNGQSNLDYVIELPVEILKLDMNMTKAFFVDNKARIVVQSTIRLAHEMDLKVVAEGVETSEHFAELQKQGVDEIQGYYFSKPLPKDEFEEFLRYHNGNEENV